MGPLRWAELLLCGLAAACSPGFELARQPAARVALHPAGIACTAGEECETGLCIEGFCCASACGAMQTCAALATRGTCVDRLPGDPCPGPGSCAKGVCVEKEHVCCASACDLPCHTCADAETPGRCRVARENTDPRGDCAGPCLACFAGSCSAALIGSNPPKGGPSPQTCAEGQSCGADAQCRAGGGRACAADADCARGSCVQGRCLTFELERIFDFPMRSFSLQPPDPDTGEQAITQERVVIDVAANDSGDTAVLFVEFARTKDGPLENDLFLAFRPADTGRWQVHLIHGDAFYGREESAEASVVFIGRSAYVVTFADDANGEGSCGKAGGLPCGVYGQLFSPDGQVSGIDPLAPDVKNADFIDVAQDGDGTLHLVWCDGNDLFRKFRRSGGAWSASEKITGELKSLFFGTSNTWYPALVGGPHGAVVLFRDRRPSDPRDSYRVAILGSDAPAGVLSVPSSVFTGKGGPCSPGHNTIADALSDRSHLGATFVVDCVAPDYTVEHVYAEFDASAPASSRFARVHPLVRGADPALEVTLSMPVVDDGHLPLFAEVHSKYRSQTSDIPTQSDVVVGWEDAALKLQGVVTAYHSPPDILSVYTMSAARGAAGAPSIAFTVTASSVGAGAVSPDLYVVRFHE